MSATSLLHHRAAVVLMAVLWLCSISSFCSVAEAATMAELAAALQARMESSGSGFSTFYRDLTEPPSVYSTYCVTNTGGSVAMISATQPFTATVTATTLQLTRASSTTGVSYNLIGASAQFDGTIDGSIQQGSTVSFTLTANRVVVVGGTITNSAGVVNFLPVAFYVMLGSSACTSSVADVSSIFGNESLGIWTSLWG